LVTITGVVSLKSLEAALMGRVPPGTEELNRKALELGIELAKNYLQGDVERP